MKVAPVIQTLRKLKLPMARGCSLLEISYASGWGIFAEILTEILKSLPKSDSKSCNLSQRTTVFGDHVLVIWKLFLYKHYSSPKSEMLKSAQVAF